MFNKLKAQTKRRVADKTPLKFKYDITVHELVGVPPDIDKVIFGWLRGSKAQYTKAAQVTGNVAKVEQELQQVATLY
ncbi:hypothetical protein CYMTET_34585, partial [Cymbomonas tetramitiformis]